MRKVWRRSIIAVLAFAALAGTQAQGRSAGKSVTVQIVAVVPQVLRLALDFSADATAQLTGYIPGIAAPKSTVSYTRPTGPRFEIKAGTVVELGNANIFSNIGSSYSVEVFSSNGGLLRDPSFATNLSVPYLLYLGDAATAARGGSFTFVRSGKSTNAGSSLRVALLIGDVPIAAPSGAYTDQLMFSIAAN